MPTRTKQCPQKEPKMDKWGPWLLVISALLLPMGRQSSPSGAPRCPKLPKGSKNNAIRVENVVEGVKTNNISLPLVIIYNACILQMGGLPLSYIYIYIHIYICIIRRPLGHEPFRVMKRFPQTPLREGFPLLKTLPWAPQTQHRAPPTFTMHP